jgi:hypothetical protein
VTEPRIQYAKTTDGVSVAFYTLGDGMPPVYLPELPLTHIQMEWQLPECRRWNERLAEEVLLEARRRGALAWTPSARRP